MNLLRMFFGNRRRDMEPVPEDRRRKGSLARHRQAGEDLDEAVRNLEATVQMSPEQTRNFRERIRAMQVVHDSPWGIVKFEDYAERCEYRKPTGTEALLYVCKHPEHPEAGGFATCSKLNCPVGRKK